MPGPTDLKFALSDFLCCCPTGKPKPPPTPSAPIEMTTWAPTPTPTPCVTSPPTSPPGMFIPTSTIEVSSSWGETIETWKGQGVRVTTTVSVTSEPTPVA